MINMRNVLVTMQKEFLETVRNRWLKGFVITFLIMSLSIGLVSQLQSHSLDMDTLNRIDESLLNLCLFFIPLMALLLSSQNVVGEKNDGFMDIILVYPISWGELILGKFLGMLGALSSGLLVGFGSSGLVLSFFTKSLTVINFLALLLFCIMLGAVFIGLGLIISCKSSSRGGAVVTSILTWLVLVVIYDLAVVQIIVSMQGLVSQVFFDALLAINPVDLARILFTHWLGLDIHVGTSNGVIDSAATPNLGMVTVVLILWMLIPLFILQRRRVSS